MTNNPGTELSREQRIARLVLTDALKGRGEKSIARVLAGEDVPIADIAAEVGEPVEAVCLKIRAAKVRLAVEIATESNGETMQ